MWAGPMEFLMRHRFRQHIKSFNQLYLEKKDSFVSQLLACIVSIDDEHRTGKELIELIQSKLSPKAGGEIVGLAESDYLSAVPI